MSRKIAKIQDAQYIDYNSQSQYSENSESIDDDELEKKLQEIKQDNSIQEFDEKQLLILIQQFNKNLQKNQELRDKFSTIPKYFMDSEIQLDQDLSQLSNIAAYPQYLQSFCDSNVIQNLMVILQHQNLDLVLHVLKVINEISQMETDNIQELQYLFEKLIENKLFEILLFLLNNNLDEQKYLSHKKGIYQILEILDNIFEISPNLINQFINTQFLEFLLDRVNSNIGVIDDNRLYASEILATVFAKSKNEIKMSEQYMRKFIYFIQQFFNINLSSEEEIETFENVSDCLTKLLIQKNNQILFQKYEGQKHCMSLIQQKNQFSSGALKILDYSIAKNKETSQNLIDIQALKYLSPILQRKGITSNNLDVQQQINQNIISIFYNLLNNTQGVYYDRVINKLRQENYERINKIFMFHNQYQIKMNQVYEQNLNEIQQYQELFDQGLETLENVDLILINLRFSPTQDIQKFVSNLINQNQQLRKDIIYNIKQYIKRLDQEKAQQEIEVIMSQLQQV